MSLRICLYEDDAFDRFFPLTLLRPVYLLRAGILPLFKRALMHFPEAPLTLIARDQVTAAMGVLAAEYPLNIIKHEAGGEVLFLNGRIRSYGNLAKLVNESRISTKFTSNGEVVAVLFKKEQLESVPPVATQTEYLAAFNRAGGDISDFETTATLYQGWLVLSAVIECAIAEVAAKPDDVSPVTHRYAEAERLLAEITHFGERRIGKAALDRRDVADLEHTIVGADGEIADCVNAVECAGGANIDFVGGGFECAAGSNGILCLDRGDD